MTTLNESQFIGDAIESIFNQTYESFEIVIVDGGSTDQTVEIIRSFDDDRIRLIVQEGLGRSASLNTAVRRSQGKYIAQVDPDDLSQPRRLERQVESLEENPQVAVVGCAFRVEDRIRGEEYVRYPPTSDSDIRSEMAKYIPLLHSGVLARREAILSVGGYNESLNDIEDLDLWIRVAQEYKLANLDDILVNKVIRPESTWHSRYSRIHRTFHHARLNFRAVRELDLPVTYYVYPIGRCVYAFLPSSVKRWVRNAFSSIDEV